MDGFYQVIDENLAEFLNVSIDNSIAINLFLLTKMLTNLFNYR